MSESTPTHSAVSEWQDLPWEMIRRRVWKLQKCIFRAATRLLMALPIGTAGGIY